MPSHGLRFCRRFLRSLVVLAGACCWPAGASAQPFSLISVAQDDGVANSYSVVGDVSADGRFVVFLSNASNLVAGDTNSEPDLFVRDRQAGTTTRVNVTSAGEQSAGFVDAAARISADGRFVAFHTSAALVPEDTNDCGNFVYERCTDIYVHDRQTGATTLASVSVTGTAGNSGSQAARISADGRFVVFASHASDLVAPVTPLDQSRIQVFLRDLQTGTTTLVSRRLDGSTPTFSSSAEISADGRFIVYSGQATVDEAPRCQSFEPCEAVYVLERETGVRTIVSNGIPPHGDGFVGVSFSPVAVSTDGRHLLLHEASRVVRAGPPFGPGPFTGRSVLLDRVTGRTIVAAFELPVGDSAILSMSGDGRVTTTHAPVGGFTLTDRVTGFDEVVTTGASPTDFTIPRLSHVGRFVAFQTSVALTGDTNGEQDVFLYDRDAGDGDGLPTAYEQTFGLNPNADDTTGDPDGDGLTTLQEYTLGSHPNATVARYFAEGAANAFFRTRFAAVNPGDAPATAVFRFLGTSGQTSSLVRTLPARSRITLSLDANGAAPENDFSTVVESDRPIVVDRTMTWDANGYGAHAETSLAAPATTWYLAEGATHGAFDLFYLLQNPNAFDASVTITYLRLAPLAPVTKVYSVPAHSRKTIWVDDEGPDLADVDVAASIVSDLPIVVERAMYSSRPGQPPFVAGHGGAGVTAPAVRWFLAEGATGTFFDMYVLVANPNAAEAQLRVTYLLATGDPVVKTYAVGAQQRLTISVQGEDARLAETPVSVIVEATNQQPVVVERAMWWPKDQWYEAHLSAGATAAGTRWAVAEGEVATDTDTYLLIANTSATAGSATVTLLIEGRDPIQTTVPLSAQNRVNVPVRPLLAGLPTDTPIRFGALIESSGPDIVVERAIYTTINGQIWSAGTDALATRLP